MNEVVISQEALIMDDLTRRVAQTSLEASQWRARALAAEAAMQKLAESIEEDEQEEQ